MKHEHMKKHGHHGGHHTQHKGSAGKYHEDRKPSLHVAHAETGVFSEAVKYAKHCGGSCK